MGQTASTNESVLVRPGQAGKPDRQSRFRLPAEFIRDNALSISGLLANEVGGPSVRSYQPAGYYKYLNFPKRD